MAKTDDDLCANTFGTGTATFREDGGGSGDGFDAALDDFEVGGGAAPAAAQHPDRPTAKTGERTGSGFWGWLRRLLGGR